MDTCPPMTPLFTKRLTQEEALCYRMPEHYKKPGPRQELPAPALEAAIIQDLGDWFH